MLQKLRQWIRKLSFPISLLLMGVLFFTWTDNWQVYTDPLRELYNRGVQLAAGARMGHTSEPGQQDGTVSGDTVPEGTEDPTGESRTPAAGETSADTQTETMTTEEPQPTEPSEELPKEVVYHTVDDSYFDDAVFIGDSRTVGMYEYGGLEETSTFYASTGLTIYKMFDSKIVAVPGQKKKITVEEALSEKQFAKIYLMIGINEMGTGTVESFMKAYGEAVQHLQQLQPDAVIYLQAIMKVTTERSGQGDYITNEGIEARNEEIAKLADDEKIYYLDVNPLICDETGGMVHKCDLCGKTLSECADNNKDHKCDLCGKTLSECADENKDHKCDLCGKTLSECADENKDHKCDLCGKTLSECADENKDHKCDLCGKTLSECADDNKDHKCDLCGKTLSECADENKDHKCDLCGKTLSECADENKDHKCDVCRKQLTDHTGGTATCKEKAVCTVCGQAYGELTAHTYKTEWTKDGEQHWHECAVCKDRRDGTAHTFEWKTDREATVTEEGAKHEECTVCGYQKPAVTIDKLAPTITEGENSRWNKGSENGLTFRSNAAYADFVEVLVDGNVISSDNYDKREGSIIIELKAGYLGTLSEGEHTITIRSGSGDATISFHVGAQIASPSTGTACVWAWIILGIIALGAGAMAVVLMTHKRNAT